MVWTRASHHLQSGKKACMCSDCGALHWLPFANSTSCPSCKKVPNEWVILHWRPVANPVLTPDSVLITIVEDEIPQAKDKENGITRNRVLWSGWIPFNGQTSIVLPAHATRRPYTNFATALHIRASAELPR